jgi:hypothetical protein
MMQVQTTVETARAEKLIIIGSISQHLAAGQAKFSIERAVEVTKERAEVTKELFVGDERLIDGALAELERQRILLLSGERGSGTSTLAVYLATRLACAKNTLVVTPLEPKVEIDLSALDCTERTTVFADAFSRRNRDLAGFFCRHDANEWGRLTEKLRTNNSYLIFTSEPEAIACFVVPRRDVPPATPELVGRGLDLRVRWLERQGLLNAEHLRPLAENRQRLIDNLKTLPNIARFLEQFRAGDANLDTALQRFHDIPFWFSNDLVTEVDAWCFALTLALAQVVRNGSGIGWYEFERIRCAVTDRLRKGHQNGPSLADDWLLFRARAEVSAEPSRLGDVVRFIDRSYAATIWQTLATHHRRVLTALIPTLRTIAEEERGPGSYAVRSLAAQMLGRLGELDPFSISIPLVQQDWADAQRPLIGRLLQGMRTSGNRAYQKAALGAVDSLTAETGDQSKTHERLLAAISAYALLGEQELGVAMTRLGAIARRLAPLVTSLHRVKRVADQVEQHLSRAESQKAADDLLPHRARLDTIAEQLSAQQGDLLLAIKQAVVYLCLTNDPVDVLDAMGEWIAHGGEETGTLVALLYLYNGIADELQAAAASVQSLSGGALVDPIARSRRNSAGAATRFAAFLSSLRTSIDQSTSLPAELRRELQELLAKQDPEGEGDETELGARTEESAHRGPAVAGGAG